MRFWELWNLSFGFFGVQIAYALQSANISRIFATLGADPHNLSYFWILPPLMGILVQPIVGTCSDRTWCRFGRRIPYLFIGATVAVLVMCLLPNAGSLGMAVSTAMIFGLAALMFLDTSINMAMQPFKMLVGDMVNEKQKGLAYSIQSFLCNAGSVVGFVFPFFFTAIGIANTAPSGVVPDSVIWSFYVGAAILILCVIYTTVKVREWPPQVYAEYNESKEEASERKASWITLLRHAPATFWRVGLVQFFCWAAFMYMWTYTNGAIADTCWNVDMHDPAATATAAYQEAGNWVGVLYAVQAIGSVIWAMVLPFFRNRKLGLHAVCCLPADRLRLGCHAGHAFHLRDQCLAGLWPHGRIPGLVQWHHLPAPNHCRPVGRFHPLAGGQQSDQHDDRGRTVARDGLRGRGWYQDQGMINR